MNAVVIIVWIKWRATTFLARSLEPAQQPSVAPRSALSKPFRLSANADGSSFQISRFLLPEPAWTGCDAPVLCQLQRAGNAGIREKAREATGPCRPGQCAHQQG